MSAHFIRSFLLIFLLGLGLILPARASLAADRTAVYHVYAGGLKVIEARLALDLGRTNYSAALEAHTRGFLGTLVPWQGRFVTTGQTSKERYIVRDHQSISTWRGQDDIAHYKYARNGQLLSLKMIDHGVDVSPPTTDPALTHHTTDILTATLNMLTQAGKTDLCNYEQDVFDSKRRFTLKYQETGRDLLKSSRYNFYQGAAIKCTAEVIPKGGAWGKKPRGWLSIQEQGRKAGTLPTLWIGKFDPKLPPLPVKIMIKTDYGTLFMHLAAIE
jgi:hypothetical protein